MLHILNNRAHTVAGKCQKYAYDPFESEFFLGLFFVDKEKRYVQITEHISHEVAHQWFYSVIGNDPYNEPWLDESFAEFFEDFVFPISGLNVIEEIELEKDKNTGVPIQRYTDFYKIKKPLHFSIKRTRVLMVD